MCGRMVAILFITVNILIHSACDQAFDPNAQHQEQLVIFSILSTDRDGQVVRVQSSYTPSGNNPNEYTLEHEVMDAKVYLKDSLSTLQLKDTLLLRPDTSRYTFPIHAYLLNGFVPKNGKSYLIEVQSPSQGNASGSAFIPDKAMMSIGSPTNSILRIPFRFTDSTNIVVSLRTSQKAKGYIFRMYVYYDVLKGNEFVEERAEIPISPLSNADINSTDTRFPGLTLLRRNANDLLIKYENRFYLETIRNLTTVKYLSNRIIYKWVVFTCLQVDENLYRYYSSVHEYRDPLSVRLDERVYSSLSNGIGMVGAYSLDSLLYVLPSNFDGNR
jgi:hypothetical protein